MFLKKALAGNAPGHSWEEDGQVIEVEDGLAEQLLNIPHGGFSVAEPPQEEEPEAPKRTGRPPLPRDETGKIIRDPSKSE